LGEWSLLASLALSTRCAGILQQRCWHDWRPTSRNAKRNLGGKTGVSKQGRNDVTRDPRALLAHLPCWAPLIGHGIEAENTWHVTSDACSMMESRQKWEMSAHKGEGIVLVHCQGCYSGRNSFRSL
jgi:hypothetical protein